MDSRSDRTWKEMTPEQKKQYFLDYYLVKTLIAAALIIFGFILVRDLLRPKREYAMRIGLYDVSLTDAEKEAFVYDVQKALNTALPVQIDDAYSSLRNEDLLRIATFSTAGRIDVIIAEEETFAFLAGYGYFKDLKESLDPAFYENYRERIVTCRGLKQSELGLLEENAEGNGDPYAAGIRIQGTGLERHAGGMKNPVLGIILESQKTADIELLLEKME
jgi:hypothetical protein